MNPRIFLQVLFVGSLALQVLKAEPALPILVGVLFIANEALLFLSARRAEHSALGQLDQKHTATFESLRARIEEVAGKLTQISNRGGK